MFKLLETLFGAFDKIAHRRKVFKVETVGDCYVAVTGLPERQPDHAVRMVKFANECMTKMSDLLVNLAEELGEDTASLEMRVGCHSGPVTGGVLRGQKGRLQLFGDVMNTAARMESTGEKGRIHISEATAKELKAKGKSMWVTPRVEMVVAKGKGEMKTYWAMAVTRASTGRSSASNESVPQGNTNTNNKAVVETTPTHRVIPVETLAATTDSTTTTNHSEHSPDDASTSSLQRLERELRSRIQRGDDRNAHNKAINNNNSSSFHSTERPASFTAPANHGGQ